MKTTYRISSHWDGRMSSLDGEEYDTFEDALEDCRRVGPDDLVAEEVDGAGEAWLVFADEATAESDRDGTSAIASIESVTAED